MHVDFNVHGEATHERLTQYQRDLRRRRPQPKLDTMSEETVAVSHAEALEKTTAALRSVGWDAEGAKVQAEIMCSSEACGNNQGLVKMRGPAPRRARSRAGPRGGPGTPAAGSTRR